MTKVTILILESADVITEGLNGFLYGPDFQVYKACNAGEAFTILEEFAIDIVLVEINRSGEFSLNFMKMMRSRYPEVETLMFEGERDLLKSLTQFPDMDSHSSALPGSWDEIQKTIGGTRSFLRYKQLKEKHDRDFALFSRELMEKEGLAIVGASSAIKSIGNLIVLVSKSEDTSVLITGESGTGKELVARGIHALSRRNSGPFNAVNCSAIPDTLFESEFFGYRKGAFTDAHEKAMGWFEQTDNGTLFLDEVSELSLMMQGKLLRVLDDKIIHKIGSREEIRLNLRVVSATNKDILELHDQQNFRQDLFHRLNAFHIHIPPLRERKEDIPVLLEYYIRDFSKRQRKAVKQTDPEAVEKLLSHPFPGNVRELKNMVERAVITSEDPVLKIKDFNLRTANRHTGPVVTEPARMLNLHEVERKAITDALESCGYNITKAAALLSISRQGLYRKMAKFGIPHRG